MSRRSIVLALCFAWSVRAVAQSPEFVRVLIPLYTTPVPGAQGSLWDVETWFYYSGPEVVEIVPRPYICGILCEKPGGPVMSGVAAHPIQPVFPHPANVLMHIPRGSASMFSFESRFRDLSRETTSAGTEVPIVREDSFSSSPLYLLNVPLRDGFRVAIRLYALPEAAAPAVELRYFRMPVRTEGGGYSPEVTLLGTEVIDLTPTGPRGGFLLHPSFAFVGSIETRAAVAAEPAVWIEVRPMSAGLRIWALVSVTNNATQQVTLITP
jgi:hypothetical protein